GTGQYVEQLVLALALEGDDAEDLARIEIERDVRELGPDGQAAGREARDGLRSAGCAGGRLGRLDRSAARDVAEHQGNDSVFGPGGHVDDADRRAFAEDGRPVADSPDLDQS